MGDYLIGIEGFFGILPRSVGEASNLPAFGSGGGQFARFQHRGCAIPCPHSILRAGRKQSKYYQASLKIQIRGRGERRAAGPERVASWFGFWGGPWRSTMVSDQCLLLLVNFLLRFKYVTMLNVLNMPRSLTILSMLTVPIMLILLIIQAMMIMLNMITLLKIKTNVTFDN